MASLSHLAAGKDGRVSLVAADSGGDTFPSGQGVIFRAVNAGGAALRLLFDAKVKSSQNVEHDLEVTVPNDGVAVDVGQFDRHRFGATVAVTYPDGVSGMTVGALLFGDLSGLD